MKKLLIGLFIASIALLSVFVSAVPERNDGFICPVFNDNSQAGVRNPNAVPIGGGDYTILGPNVEVPVHAMNADGAGSPGGEHSSPGDSDYTPIWNLE